MLVIDKVRIAYIVSSLKRCGPMVQLLGLIQGLNRERFQPSIITLSPEPEDTMIQSFLENDVKINSLGLKRRESFLGGKLRKQLSEISPMIVHSHGIRADFLAATFLQDYYTCNTIHSFAFEDYGLTYGRVMGSLLARQHCRFIRRIIVPISCSRTVADKLARSVQIEPEVVPNGVDTKVFVPVTTEEKLMLRKKLGIPLDCTLFVSTGNLSVLKDPVTLIKGFQQAQLANSKLVVLGDGPLKDVLAKEADDSVIIAGKVSNVHQYLKAADVYVSCSQSEGLPMAVLEAMSTGIPVVLSNIDSHREVLQDQQRAGLTFPTGDATELATQLRKLMGMNVGEMGRQARKIVLDNYSYATMSKGYQDIYESIAQRYYAKERKQLL